MRAISHVAIGVSDMKRSLPFYRDLLGLKVSLDTEETIKFSAKSGEPAEVKRHAIYMRWEDGPRRDFYRAVPKSSGCLRAAAEAQPGGHPSLFVLGG